MNLRISIVLTFALALAGCSGQAQQLQLKTLPSGKQIRMIGMGPIHFTKEPPGLMFQYQTDLKIADVKKLRREVDEIWDALRVDAEKGRYTTAIISANEVPSGTFVKKNATYNFVFQKRADGWHCLEDDKK
jgi:hypothetical protein